MNILFIGNRMNVLRELLDFNKLITISEILVLEGSQLEIDLKQEAISYQLFSLGDKQIVLDKIKSSEFDIIISNGCPFILPVSKIKLPHQKFINIHPTYLPYLKGKTPINGIFYNKMTFLGATMHFMDDGIDTGQIIHQEKVNLTQDIDLPMAYYMSFRLEGIVFREGFYKYILNEEKIEIKEKEVGSYFSRVSKIQRLSFHENNEDIISKIKAFGISNQGCNANIEGKRILIFSAIEIINQKFLDWFCNEPIGKLILELDKSLYIRTGDGIVKITKYKWHE